MPLVRAKCPECGHDGMIAERLDGLRRLCHCGFEWNPRVEAPKCWSCGTTAMVEVAPGARNFVHLPGCQR